MLYAGIARCILAQSRWAYADLRCHMKVRKTVKSPSVSSEAVLTGLLAEISDWRCRAFFVSSSLTAWLAAHRHSTPAIRQLYSIRSPQELSSGFKSAQHWVKSKYIIGRYARNAVKAHLWLSIKQQLVLHIENANLQSQKKGGGNVLSHFFTTHLPLICLPMRLDECEWQTANCWSGRQSDNFTIMWKRWPGTGIRAKDKICSADELVNMCPKQQNSYLCLFQQFHSLIDVRESKFTFKLRFKNEFKF